MNFKSGRKSRFQRRGGAAGTLFLISFLFLSLVAQLSWSRQVSQLGGAGGGEDDEVLGANEALLVSALSHTGGGGGSSTPSANALHLGTTGSSSSSPAAHRGNNMNKGRRGWSRRTSKHVRPFVPVESSSTRTIRADLSLRGNTAPPSPVTKQWLELETIPPSKISAKLHSEVVLECEAVGSPPPLIYWLKNGKPVDTVASFDSEEMVNGLDTHDSLLERRSHGNFIPSDFAMAKIKSKLPLRCIRPEEEAEYSCIADNFGHQLIATTNVVIEEDDTSDEWRPECEFRLPSFFYTKKGARKGTKAYVHVAESLHMEAIGKDIILPCRGGGKPKPHISWTGADGQPILIGKKFQLNTKGDLLINNLSWNEMGEYTCLVENQLGYEVASTFLYPLLGDEEPQPVQLQQQQQR